jgi:hypothetical protein
MSALSGGKDADRIRPGWLGWWPTMHLRICPACHLRVCDLEHSTLARPCPRQWCPARKEAPPHVVPSAPGARR